VEPSGPRSRKSNRRTSPDPKRHIRFAFLSPLPPLPSEVDGPAGRRSPAGPSRTWAIPAALSGAAAGPERIATLLRFSCAAQGAFSTKRPTSRAHFAGTFAPMRPYAVCSRRRRAPTKCGRGWCAWGAAPGDTGSEGRSGTRPRLGRRSTMGRLHRGRARRHDDGPGSFQRRALPRFPAPRSGHGV
jgi:hypothetical protein